MKFAAMLKKFMASAPLFLLLAPVYVVLHLEKVFHTQINYRFVMVQIYIMLIASVVFILSCILLLRDKKKACLVAFILMLAWYYLGMLKNAMEEYYPNSFFSSYKYYLPLSAIVTFFLVYRIRNFKGSLNRLFLFINVLWLIFITLDIILLAFSGKVNLARQNRYAISLPIHDLENSQKPDIYYIVFDSYSGNSVLKKMGFDNNEIEINLTESGFKIVSGSRSNYNMTPFSIASTFNMKYLDGVDTKKKYFLNDYYSAVNAVKWNGLIPWLMKNGYDFDAYSIFDFPGHPSINKNYDIWNIDGLFLQNNLALKVYKDISWNFKRKPFNIESKDQNTIEQKNEYDDAVYSNLLNVSRKGFTKPVFIYAHFIMPHPPNGLTSSGHKFTYNNKLSEKENENRYTEEIMFVNKRIRTIVDTLTKNTKRPMVIIMQGDHGYRFWKDGREQDEFPNFSAVYFSNKDYHMVPDTLSNVNLFKAVLNTFFHQKIPFDTNKQYFLHYR